MRGIFKHLKTHIFRGLLAVLPLGLSYLVIRFVYTLGKQLADALSLPEKGAFKRVVMVEHFRPGVWSVGFVTATLKDRDTGEDRDRVFIPTAPNPTSGFVVMLKSSQVREVDWSVHEAMNSIISGGMVGPERI